LKNSNTTHFVGGVDCTRNGASASGPIVFDSGTGSKYTLQNVMNQNSMAAVMNYILTQRH